MLNKKPQKNLESDFSVPIGLEGDATVELASLIAHLIVGVNPYLDISTVHLLVMELIVTEVTEDSAYQMGQTIAKRARISIPDDCPGGLQ